MVKGNFVGSFFVIAFLLLTGAHAKAEKTTISLPSIKNFSSPEPNRYRSGQPSSEEFKVLAKKGVKHVIDLRPAQETPDSDEAAQVMSEGMAYYNIPISSADDLTIENVRIIDDILLKAGEENVLMHCASSNRVGAIMALRAAWLNGKSKNSAIEIGKSWGLTRLQSTVEKQLSKKLEHSNK